MKRPGRIGKFSNSTRAFWTFQGICAAKVDELWPRPRPSSTQSQTTHDQTQTTLLRLFALEREYIEHDIQAVRWFRELYAADRKRVEAALKFIREKWEALSPIEKFFTAHTVVRVAPPGSYVGIDNATLKQLQVAINEKYPEEGYVATIGAIKKCRMSVALFKAWPRFTSG